MLLLYRLKCSKVISGWDWISEEDRLTDGQTADPPFEMFLKILIAFGAASYIAHNFALMTNFIESKK